MTKEDKKIKEHLFEKFPTILDPYVVVNGKVMRLSLSKGTLYPVGKG